MILVGLARCARHPVRRSRRADRRGPRHAAADPARLLRRRGRPVAPAVLARRHLPRPDRPLRHRGGDPRRPRPAGRRLVACRRPRDVGGWTVLGLLVARRASCSTRPSPTSSTWPAPRPAGPLLEDVAATTRSKVSGTGRACDAPSATCRSSGPSSPSRPRCSRSSLPSSTPSTATCSARRSSSSSMVPLAVITAGGHLLGRAHQLEAGLMTGSRGVRSRRLPGCSSGPRSTARSAGCAPATRQLTARPAGRGLPTSATSTPGRRGRRCASLPAAAGAAGRCTCSTSPGCGGPCCSHPSSHCCPGRTVLVLHSGSTGRAGRADGRLAPRALRLALHAYDEIWAVNDEIGAILPAALRARITRRDALRLVRGVRCRARTSGSPARARPRDERRSGALQRPARHRRGPSRA